MHPAPAQDPQSQYWVKVAREALAHYAPALQAASCTVLARTHNVVFLLESPSQRHILRLHTYAMPLHRLESEMQWLAYLAQAGISVPRPVPTQAGAWYALAQAEPQMAGVVFEYLGGEHRPLEALSLGDMRAIGVLLAQLHQAADGFSLPPDFALNRLDLEGLFGEMGRYALGGLSNLFSSSTLNHMSAVVEQVRHSFAQLQPQAGVMGILHGDLHQQNILFEGEHVHALDFEYAGIGFYLYDFTPLLWQLKLRPNYAELEHTLWDAYTALRPLPEHRQHLETLIAARQVASMRWLALNRDNPSIHPHAERLIAQRDQELQTYLQTGILQRKP